jgi:hypothetical protein
MNIVLGGYYRISNGVWKVLAVGKTWVKYEVYDMNGQPVHFGSTTSLKWFTDHVKYRVIQKRKLK